LHAPRLEHTNSATTDTSIHSIADTIPSPADTIPRSSEASLSPSYPYPSPVTALFPRDTSILIRNEEQPHNVPPSFPIPVIVVSSPLLTEVPQMGHIHSAPGPRSLPPIPLTGPSHTSSEATSPLDVGPTLDPKMIDAHQNTRVGDLLAVTEPTHHQRQPTPSYPGSGRDLSPPPQDDNLSGLPNAALQGPDNMRF